MQTCGTSTGGARKRRDLNLLPSHRLGTRGQWATALHSAAGCLLAALALMHLHFVHTDAT